MSKDEVTKEAIIPGHIIITDKPTEKDPWIHRSKYMRCITCMWFVGKKKQQHLQ